MTQLPQTAHAPSNALEKWPGNGPNGPAQTEEGAQAGHEAKRKAQTEGEEMTAIRITPEMRQMRHTQSADNRPIFRRESSDQARPQSSSLRQVPGRQSSSRPLASSRHFSRQNGEREAPERRFSGDPAVYPAILRDPPAFRCGNGQSCHLPCQNGRKRTKSGHRFRDPKRQADPSAVVPQGGTKAETYRPIGEIAAELDAIEAEARETDKALRDILKKIGVAS